MHGRTAARQHSGKCGQAAAAHSLDVAQKGGRLNPLCPVRGERGRLTQAEPGEDSTGQSREVKVVNQPGSVPTSCPKSSVQVDVAQSIVLIARDA